MPAGVSGSSSNRRYRWPTTYVEGYRLLRCWLDTRDPDEALGERYRRLLDEPLTPAGIRAELAA